MAISDELTRIQTAKADIKASIEAKGVTVPSDALIDAYDTYIGQISGGGGGQAEEDLKNLIERDITSITIPSSVTSIGDSAFRECTSLTSVTIPNGVTYIGHYAFRECISLTSITIPSSVTSIGNYAFQNCQHLTNLTIPNSVTSIGNYAFQNCQHLTNLTIPNNVTSISNYAFSSCTGLTSVTIPDSVTSISDSAFGGCSSLTSVTIPNSVTSIGSFAFWNCTGLTSVSVFATTPPILGSINTFNNTNNCPIYVPAESADTYKAAIGWSRYADRIQGTIFIDDDMEVGTDNGLYTIADTVVEGEPGARITANTGELVGYYNSENDEYYDKNGELIDLSEYNFDFDLYLEEVYGITSDSGGGF